MSRGAPRAPITYEGVHDPARTYLPRQVATKGGTAFLSLATSTGVDPGTDPTVWLPLGGAGAAIVGYAEISISWGTVVSDDSAVGATSVSITTTAGTPDISVSSSTFLEMNTGLADSLYLIKGDLTVRPGLNHVASDLWRIEVADPLDAQRFLGSSFDTQLWTFAVGTLEHWPSGFTNTRTPSAVIKCSGGTNREFAVDAKLFIARFATPT